MENREDFYHVAMMCIVNLLEECPKLPDLLCIPNKLLYELRKLDAYGQKLISTKANQFLSIDIDHSELQLCMEAFANHVQEQSFEGSDVMPLTAAQIMSTQSKLHQVCMMSIINLLEECPHLPDLLNIHNDLLYRLRKLNAYGQRFITSQADTFLSIDMDSLKLQKQMDTLTVQIGERELEEEFINRLAPCKLMRQLFGMHTTEFTQRRKFLGLSKQGQHRPRYCSKETELIIWQHWKRSEGMDERERYLSVAQQTNQPLNLIYGAVKSYYESELI